MPGIGQRAGWGSPAAGVVQTGALCLRPRHSVGRHQSRIVALQRPFSFSSLAWSSNWLDAIILTVRLRKKP